ncbi:MAG: site-2 protease family protein [Bdellovibrionales bacterium]|nr:site-2 protease family protein [Bdellovibrionales bacterium]
MFTPEQISLAILFFIPFLFSLCFHEYAHGWMARLKGDRTAEMMGRLTLNPMAHIDVVGTVILPIMAILTSMPLFGWAKPVPVNSRNLARPRQDMFWIALAGPASNILLFLVGLVILAVLIRQNLFDVTQPMIQMSLIFLKLNLYLAFFNLLPLHPLDGGKVIARFIPIKWDTWLETNQMILSVILMLFVIMGVLRFLAYPVDWIVRYSVDLINT